MKIKNLLVILLVIVSTLASVLNCNAAETRNYAGFMTVTLSDGWRFGNDKYYLDFYSVNNPSHIFGFMNSYGEEDGYKVTARQLAEESRAIKLSNGEQCSEIYDHFLGGYNGLKAAFYYTYDTHDVSGEPMTNEHLFAIRGGVGITFDLSGPSDQWKKPGILTDVDFILNNVRFY